MIFCFELFMLIQAYHINHVSFDAFFRLGSISSWSVSITVGRSALFWRSWRFFSLNQFSFRAYQCRITAGLSAPFIHHQLQMWSSLSTSSSSTKIGANINVPVVTSFLAHITFEPSLVRNNHCCLSWPGYHNTFQVFRVHQSDRFSCFLVHVWISLRMSYPSHADLHLWASFLCMRIHSFFRSWFTKALSIINSSMNEICFG